jgi:predicted MFS family arabinose efflux permease
VLATLSLTVTVSYGVMIYAFPVLLRPMERDLGVTRGQASAALSIGLLVSAFAAFPVGRWLDRRSPRHLMTFGSLLAGAALLCWAAVTSLWQLYAVFGVMGIAMATLLYGPAFTVLAKLFWPSPRRALTVLTLFGGLAGIVFTPLTDGLVQSTSWRTTLVVLAGVAVLLTAIPHAVFLPRGVAHSAGLTSSPSDGDSISTKAAIRGMAFWALTLALFLGYFTSVALVVHLIPYLTERGFSPAFAALAAGLVGAMQIPGRALMLPLERRVPRAALTTGVFGLEGLTLLILLLGPSTGAVLAFVVCFGMVRGMVPLVGATLVADFYGPASYGAIGGAMGFFTTIAQALAPGGVGLLYDHFNGYREVIWILVAAGAAAALSAFWAERHAPPRHPPV